MNSQNKHTKKSKVPFGLKEGKLYEPSQVPRGKACGCICPSCGKPLVAKKGSINKKHFSHAINNSCESGRETAIHLAAKQIIFETKSVYLPPIQIQGSLKRYGVTTFDEIILETAIPSLKEQMRIIPDITATLSRKNDAKNLYIEIAVTHFLEEKKINALKNNKFSSIEIDLSSLYNEDDVDFEVIENIIKNGEHTTWIYNQKDEIEKERIRKEDEEAEIKHKHFLSEKRERMKNIIKLYNEEKERKKDTSKWDKSLHEYSKKVLGINSLDELPEFIIRPCDIDALYPIDGRMVRLFIYEYIVVHRKNIPGFKERAFNEKQVIQYLKSEKKLYPNSFIYDWNKTDSNGDNYESYLTAVDLDVAKPNFDSWLIIGLYLYSLTKEGVLEYLEYGRGGRFKLPTTKKHKSSYNIYPARTLNDDSDFKLCKLCNKPLPLSAEYCENCLEVQ